MVELLPKMEPEAPDGYVSFVGRHLDTLRLESAQLAGDAWHAEEIYPEALTDVARRWQWLELLAKRFGRPAAADDYLRRVLTDRAKRWRAEQIYEVDMVVLRADPAAPGPAEDGDELRGSSPAAGPPGVPGRSAIDPAPERPTVLVGGAARMPPAPFTGGMPLAPFTGGTPIGRSAGLTRYRRTGPGRSSLGLKQARFLSPLRHPPAPIAEAAIAWWHAYVAQRRRRRVVTVIAVILFLAALTNLRTTGRI